jgi:hypothetical protein
MPHPTKKSTLPCCFSCKNLFSNPPGSSHTWSETVYTHNKKNYCKYCYVGVIGAPDEDEAYEMVKDLNKLEKK